MSKIILIVGAVIIIGLLAVFVLQPSEQEPGGEEIVKVESPRDPNTVIASESGFSPAELTIQKGGTITFRNENNRKVWPASDIHPTHTAYPDSSIQKCFDGSDLSSVFDACRGLEEGEEFSFEFNEVGTWRFHDHLRPSTRATIVVE